MKADFIIRRYIVGKHIKMHILQIMLFLMLLFVFKWYCTKTESLKLFYREFPTFRLYRLLLWWLIFWCCMLYCWFCFRLLNNLTYLLTYLYVGTNCCQHCSGATGKISQRTNRWSKGDCHAVLF